MRCTLRLLVPLMLLAAPAAGLAQSPKYNVGTPLSQEEIKSFDFLIGPQGQELPAGSGSAKEGATREEPKEGATREEPPRPRPVLFPQNPFPPPAPSPP